MQLPSIQTDRQGYTLLELDNLQTWWTGLGLDASVVGNRQLLQNTLQEILAQTPGSVSGVVLEPELGPTIVKAKPAEVGVVWRLEEPTADPDPANLPTFAQDWTVEHIRNNLGLAKLELSYHPAEAHALVKKQLLAEVYDFCQYQHIQLLLKLVVYSPTAQSLSPEEFKTAQLTAIQELRSQCDILALQSPQEALAAATLTAELDIPWVMTAPINLPYDQCKDQLRQCLEAGGRGFLFGDCLWPEAYRLKRKDQGVDEPALKSFVQTTLRDRLIELQRVVSEVLIT